MDNRSCSFRFDSAHKYPMVKHTSGYDCPWNRCWHALSECGNSGLCRLGMEAENVLYQQPLLRCEEAARVEKVER